MLEDVLLITEKHANAAKKIVHRINKPTINKFIIAIGGESGSGKSEVAHMVGKLLKKENNPAKIIHTDNYYKTLPENRTALRKKMGMESVGLSEYKWELIQQHLNDFKQNKKSTLPCIDLISDQVDKLMTNFNGINILILEGLYSLGADADLKILIDLTYHETKKAQILRGKERVDEFRYKILQREHEAVQSLRQTADLLITKEFDVVDANTVPVQGVKAPKR